MPIDALAPYVAMPSVGKQAAPQLQAVFHLLWLINLIKIQESCDRVTLTTRHYNIIVQVMAYHLNHLN